MGWSVDQSCPPAGKKRKKIKFACVVAGCANTDPDRWFHRFPRYGWFVPYVFKGENFNIGSHYSNAVMRGLWVEATGIKTEPTSGTMVCSAHFLPRDYSTNIK